MIVLERFEPYWKPYFEIPEKLEIARFWITPAKEVEIYKTVEIPTRARLKIKWIPRTKIAKQISKRFPAVIEISKVLLFVPKISYICIKTKRGIWCGKPKELLEKYYRIKAYYC
ncbi:MAG: hypothetical protein J7J54_06480 [Candidatus Omnitrophica bacterium]|nr:hypothetical protein [Candidatus Omnitrophota bacterium]